MLNFLGPLKKIEAFLGFLNNVFGMEGPGQAVGDLDTRKREGPNHFHWQGC